MREALTIGLVALAASQASAGGISITDHGATAGQNAREAFVRAADVAARRQTSVYVPPWVWRFGGDFTATVPVELDGVLDLDAGASFRMRCPAQPVRISDYLKIHAEGTRDWREADPAKPARHRWAFEAALADLFATRRKTLDLEGLELTLDTTAVIATPDADDRLIHNGSFRPHEGWWNEHAALLEVGTTEYRMKKLNLAHLSLHGKGVASGIRLRDHLDVRLRTVSVDQPAKYGIRVRAAKHGGLHIMGCKVLSSTSRTVIGIDLDDSTDQKVINNRIVNCTTAILSKGHGNLFLGNHLWSYPPNNGVANTDHYVGFDLGPNPQGVIAGNYIDTMPIKLTRPRNGPKQTGNLLVTGNRIAMWGATPDTPLILVTNADPSEEIRLENLVVSSNQVRVWNVGRVEGGPYEQGARIERPFQAHGGIGKEDARGVIVTDNYFSGGVLSQSTAPTIEVTLNGGSAYGIDVSRAMAFGLSIRGVKSIGVMSDGNPGTVWFQRSSRRQGTLRLSAGARGTAHLTLLGSEPPRW